MSSITKPSLVNNFDVLRLISATLVIFAHGFILYGYDTSVRTSDSWLATQLWSFWHFLQINAGNLGVEVFFVISGFLISKSIISNPAQWIYWQKRLLRIMPGLAVCVLLSALLMGPAFSKLPLATYFSEPNTWVYLVSISMYKLGSELPGVFSQNPLPEINGSLWTLRYEFTCYIMVAVFSLIGIIRSRGIMLGLYVFLLVLIMALQFYPLSHKLEYVLIYTDLATTKLLSFVALFMTGIVYNLFQPYIQIKGWHAGLALALTILIHQFPGLNLGGFTAPLSGVIIFWLSYLPTSAFVKHPLGNNDYSYGIYIYGMPVQQMVMALIGTSVSVGWYITISVVATLPFAMLSWHFIEKPMLSLKPKTVG